MHKCPKCGKEFEKQQQYAVHCKHAHPAARPSPSEPSPTAAPEAAPAAADDAKPAPAFVARVDMPAPPSPPAASDTPPPIPKPPERQVAPQYLDRMPLPADVPSVAQRLDDVTGEDKPGAPAAATPQPGAEVPAAAGGTAAGATQAPPTGDVFQGPEGETRLTLDVYTRTFVNANFKDQPLTDEEAMLLRANCSLGVPKFLGAPMTFIGIFLPRLLRDKRTGPKIEGWFGRWSDKLWAGLVARFPWLGDGAPVKPPPKEATRVHEATPTSDPTTRAKAARGPAASATVDTTLEPAGDPWAAAYGKSQEVNPS